MFQLTYLKMIISVHITLWIFSNINKQLLTYKYTQYTGWYGGQMWKCGDKEIRRNSSVGSYKTVQRQQVLFMSANMHYDKQRWALLLSSIPAPFHPWRMDAHICCLQHSKWQLGLHPAHNFTIGCTPGRKVVAYIGTRTHSYWSSSDSPFWAQACVSL